MHSDCWNIPINQVKGKKWLSTAQTLCGSQPLLSAPTAPLHFSLHRKSNLCTQTGQGTSSLKNPPHQDSSEQAQEAKEEKNPGVHTPFVHPIHSLLTAFNSEKTLLTDNRNNVSQISVLWASVGAKALINLCCISYTIQNTVLNMKTNHTARHTPQGFVFVFQTVMPEMLQAY